VLARLGGVTGTGNEPAARTRTGDRPSEPPQSDAVVPVTVGTALWALGLVVTLAFRGTLERHDAQWWVWTSVTGLGLGLFGCWWVRRRRARLRARSTGQPSG
jgi:hypothetical protein